MQVRDKLNTLENYSKSRDFYCMHNRMIADDILEIEEDEKKGVQKNHFPNARVIRNMNDSIAMNLFKIFKNRYSSGSSMSEVREAFLAYLEIKSLVLNGHIHYLDDLDIISVGILLDIDAETMEPFIENIEQVNYQDYLMDFLIRYYRPDWSQHEEIRFKRPYAHAKAIIEAEDQEKALGALRHYVFSKWYPGSNDAPWYNSHKSKNPAFHDGYWSFEAGAIAKILGLDDSSLEGQQYYPYDMVHWKG